MLGRKTLAAIGILGLAALGTAARGAGGSTTNVAPAIAWTIRTLNGAVIPYCDVTDANGAADLKSVRINLVMTDGSVMKQAEVEKLISRNKLIVSDITNGKRYRFMAVPSILDSILVVARDFAGNETVSTAKVSNFTGGGPSASPGSGSGTNTTKH